ncbi:CWF19-like protein 1 [Halotydeus destructor]|nr:CWF19-like protein 1 [Halotydeus destructor]
MVLVCGRWLDPKLDSDPVMPPLDDLPPLYVLCPEDEDDDQGIGRLNPNWRQGFEMLDGQLTFLGSTGILHTSAGLCVAYGSHAPSEASVFDILVTSRWPRGVTKYASGAPDESGHETDHSVALAVARLKPRYHFSPSRSPVFFERQPFRNHQVLSEQARPVTRFVSLAPVANTLGAKWLYAFNVVPAKQCSRAQLGSSQTDDTTENPFLNLLQGVSEKGEDEDSTASNPQFFYATAAAPKKRPAPKQTDKKNEEGSENQGMQRNKVARIPVAPAQCWFCLGSPDVDKELVVSVGNHSYLAAAKGGLSGKHMLILPISHVRSTVEIEQQELLDELDQFKASLREMFSGKVVFFERNFRSDHLQIQVVPLTREADSEGEESEKDLDLKSLLQERGLAFQELAPGVGVNQVVKPGIPYFHIEYGTFSYLVFIRKGTFFPLQLGRELLVQGLALPEDKVDWKQCVVPQAEAKEQVAAFRREYSKFDFTLSL